MRITGKHISYIMTLFKNNILLKVGNHSSNVGRGAGNVVSLPSRATFYKTLYIVYIYFAGASTGMFFIKAFAQRIYSLL